MSNQELNFSQYKNDWRPSRNYRVVTKSELRPGMMIDIGQKEFVLEVIYHPITGVLCAQTYGGPADRDFIYWDNFDRIPSNDALFCVKG